MQAPGQVVGVAILRWTPAPAVLAARRVRPVETAGRWELPGGACEPGETCEDAAAREIREELGCQIQVEAMLPGSSAIRPGLELRVATATLRSGIPTPHEHDTLRWLTAAELDDVDWLEPDRPFLRVLSQILRSGAGVDPS